MQNLIGEVTDRSYNAIRRPRIANFADIIKIAITFIKKILKNIEKVKRISVSVFLDITKVADLRWNNTNGSRTQGVFHVIYIFFGSTLGKACVTDFRKENSFSHLPPPPPIHEQHRKCASWIGLTSRAVFAVNSQECFMEKKHRGAT